MSLRRVNEVSSRLSLRPPQRASLEILDRIFETVALGKTTDPATALAAIAGEYPSVTDFEREFPSLCFALATGVGKTRLMGAFIAYMHLARGLNDFFVLAPNLTIYTKLIADFTPGSRKYVFTGMGEFSSNGVEIITGDNYSTGRGVREPAPARPTRHDAASTTRRPDWQPAFEFDRAAVHINIFNISKINGEVRGGKSAKIKRLHEYIGQSYFDYLAGLSNLVLIMDESHRYRGTAGVKVLNELRPILGLELTATPQTESGTKTFPFKNIIYNYPLATAMADGFVKEPAVATQANFRPEDYKDRPDELEDIKLRDGITIHENTKVELELYARQFDQPLVKPFMLVVAQDTTHANEIVERIKRDDFFNGQYRDKVMVVHSRLSGEEEDETIEKLLSVESAANPIEIVVHVNKLKEGWDVTNLYTIVPLRAASSKTLVEQSIGRGLRLPYGQRTGPTTTDPSTGKVKVSPVDRLTIVAHDRFQAIIDEANNPHSIIRAEIIIGRDIGFERKQVREVKSAVERALTEPPAADGPPAPHLLTPFTTEADRQVAGLALRAISEVARNARLVPGATALRTPEVRAVLERKVAAALIPRQPEFAVMSEPPDVAEITRRVVEQLILGTIDLPRIQIMPTSAVTIGFHDFDINAESIRYQPLDKQILIQDLRTNNREMLTSSGEVIREARPEDYLVRGLIDQDDVDYEEQADLLYKWSGQVVAHLRSYLPTEEAIHNVLQHKQKTLVDLIYAQMQQHRWERATGYEAIVSQGFAVPIRLAFDEIKGEPVRHFRESVEPKSAIPRLLFGGFERCLYSEQKFSSDPERRFAILLEDEREQLPLKWFKPARNQFKILFRAGENYEPDFVVETATRKYLCEPKMRKEMDDPIVLDKARAAAAWCLHATKHETDHGGKPWSYLLIPHDAITASATLAGLAASYTHHAPADERISPLLITR